MQRGLIELIWQQQFGELPDERFLSLFSTTFNTDDDERRFSWLLMQSSGRHFDTEDARAAWIADGTWRAELEGDSTLPPWK
ncbi:MAG TPA: hypothetical protein VFA60_01120 [Terriglobales bacterium]|nr:hypothetical protein [Terriglobales bacterium]